MSCRQTNPIPATWKPKLLASERIVGASQPGVRRLRHHGVAPQPHRLQQEFDAAVLCRLAEGLVSGCRRELPSHRQLQMRGNIDRQTLFTGQCTQRCAGEKIHATITGPATELACFRLQEDLALDRVHDHLTFPVRPTILADDSAAFSSRLWAGCFARFEVLGCRLTAHGSTSGRGV